MHIERAFNAALGATIKRWRKQKGWKQSELAQRASEVAFGGYMLNPISEPTIGNIERAIVVPRFEDIVRICIALDKSMLELANEIEKTLKTAQAYLQARSSLYSVEDDALTNP